MNDAMSPDEAAACSVRTLANFVARSRSHERGAVRRHNSSESHHGLVRAIKRGRVRLRNAGIASAEPRQPALSRLGGSRNGRRDGLSHRPARAHRSNRSQAPARQCALHHLRRQALQRSRAPIYRSDQRDAEDAERGWISRYAWGDDYHDVLRRGLGRAGREARRVDHEYKICVDTAPLARALLRAPSRPGLDRQEHLSDQSGDRLVGLSGRDSYFAREIEPDTPPPDRCGTCTRCIDACPTQAIAPEGYEIDARRCISYFTIELHGAAPEEMRGGIGQHVFGCDICQDVCPWNGRAPVAKSPPSRLAILRRRSKNLAA
jgi:ferredoxin